MRGVKSLRETFSPEGSKVWGWLSGVMTVTLVCTGYHVTMATALVSDLHCL